MWIAKNQIGHVAMALKPHEIAAKTAEIDFVQNQPTVKTLTELTHLYMSYDGKSVSFWGLEGDEPILAVAQFPNGQLSVATKGAILLPFNNGDGESLNAALLTTCDQRFQFFGQNPKNIIPHPPAFCVPDSNLIRIAEHMICKPHDCSLECGPAKGGPKGMA